MATGGRAELERLVDHICRLRARTLNGIRARVRTLLALAPHMFVQEPHYNTRCARRAGEAIIEGLDTSSELSRRDRFPAAPNNRFVLFVQ